MKKRVLKSLAIAAASVCIAGSLTGCTMTSSSTVTTTETDADGNSTTTTTTTENGKTTTETETTTADGAETITATLEVDNYTGVDIYELYVSSNDSDEWGNDLLADRDPMPTDSYLKFSVFNYDADHMLWDLKAVDQNGDSLSFKGIDLSMAGDPENLVIELVENDEGGYKGVLK